MDDLTLDHFRCRVLLFIAEIFVLEEPRRAADRCQRVAQFMREHRQKFVLALIRLCQLNDAPAQPVLELPPGGDVFYRYQDPLLPMTNAREWARIDEHHPRPEQRKVTRDFDIGEHAMLG